MTTLELELLEALIDMCDQYLYCENTGDYDNDCMCAGENALELLDKLELLEDYNGRCGSLDMAKWQKMRGSK